ncbi:MAG: cupredoxin domain-containing protein [Gemmatimonadales bacterium]
MNGSYRVALVAALVVACSGDGTGAAACGSGGTAASVRVCDNFFAPAASPISASASVSWTWRGGNPHNVTFEDGQGSSATQTSGTHNRSFTGAGSFRYRCTVHSSDFNSGMVGSVTVQ